MDLKLVGEHWKDNLSGLHWNKRVKDAIAQAHLREIRIRKAELDISRLESGLDIDQSIADASFVSVLNPRGRIEEVGFNTPEDLFMDNFGKWLSAMFIPPQHPKYGQTGVTLYNTSNTAKQFTFSYATYYGSSRYNAYNDSGAGTQFQFGSSSAVATRSQYCVQSALLAAPESGRFNTGPAFASSACVLSFSGGVTAGGSGSINELCLFAYWNYQGAYDTFMLARDVLAAPVIYAAQDRLIAVGVISC